MLVEIEKLLELQARDQSLLELKKELAAIPGERAAREKQIADSAERLEKAKTRAREIEVERNTLEVEVKTKRDAIARYKQQQLQTRKNEEYAALAHEIEAAEKVITNLEDQELVLMEETETLSPQIKQAEATHAEEKKDIQTRIESLAKKSENIETRIAEVEAESAQAAEGIDEDLLDTYRRLFKSKNGSAIVPLEGDVCSGCHMRVTTQTVVQVKSAKSITHCPQCGRILYAGE